MTGDQQDIKSNDGPLIKVLLVLRKRQLRPFLARDVGV